jgi:hypothetical protein
LWLLICQAYREGVVSSVPSVLSPAWVVGGRFEPRIFVPNQSAVDGFDGHDHDGDDGATADRPSLPTEWQRSASSESVSSHYDGGPHELDNDYIVDVFASGDEDEDGADARSRSRSRSRGTKRRKLSTSSY